jgi:insecticidal toxin complex protein TccC
MNTGIHAQTPNLSVIDNRGLSVRQVAYWRKDSNEPEPRFTTRQHDAAGRLVAQRDPRLFTDASASANLATVYSLSGQVLSTFSVDAGWRINLSGEARQPLHGWDGRGSQRKIAYDEHLRPLAVFEHARDGEPVCAERYGYGGSDPTLATRNQCGQLIRHDDSAGMQLFEQFGLSGGVLQQTRHFLRSLDFPDWPEPLPGRDELLESGAGATSRAVSMPWAKPLNRLTPKVTASFSHRASPDSCAKYACNWMNKPSRKRWSAPSNTTPKARPSRKPPVTT